LHIAHFGEFAALLTAVFWTITAIAFEQASKKVGSLTVNLIRLVIAFFLLGIFGFFYRGYFFPSDASLHAWIWLAMSGIVGFVIGDYFLFQSYVVVGARISMLIMAMAPPISAFASWLLMGETLSPKSLLGMILTLIGIAIVVLRRTEGESNRIRTKHKSVKFSYPIKGLLLAFGGAAGQGIGLVLSKYGMKDYDAFAASQIRVLTGALGFALLFCILRMWNKVGIAIKDRTVMKRLAIGSFFGPFLGVSFSLLAVQNTSAGIASTIMAIVPVLIIPPALIINKEKLKWKEVMGAILAVIGVAIFFL